ncbi:hypothetical protein L2E82_18574 [Cichorium intybus]|uniref:Uncharacterized protein n=1 Tax=Cichorium intybus TaxID=13427 RepID=A0ACB9FAZ4_CICIN|nr:hypothetical protein L2E82_18574 [Cichorium intybus]
MLSSLVVVGVLACSLLVVFGCSPLCRLLALSPIIAGPDCTLYTPRRTTLSILVHTLTLCLSLSIKDRS